MCWPLSDQSEPIPVPTLSGKDQIDPGQDIASFSISTWETIIVEAEFSAVATLYWNSWVTVRIVY